MYLYTYIYILYISASPLPLGRGHHGCESQGNYAYGLLPPYPPGAQKPLPEPRTPPLRLNFWPPQDGAQSALKIHTEKVMPQGAQKPSKMEPKLHQKA